MACIEVKALSLARNGLPVLHSVDATVCSGEILVIMGPSGSGKSSLLRCLNRLADPSGGQVLLDGVDLADLPVIDVRQRVGMIFQKTTPFTGTIAENLNYGPSLRGETLSRDRMAELLTLASLDPALLERPATELSGGQEQRLAIARALANEPDVLLLDEPTSALDPIATHTIEDTMIRLRNTLGLTLIWVTHTADQAKRIGGQLLMLDAGHVVCHGPVAELMDAQTGDSRVLAFAAGETQVAV